MSYIKSLLLQTNRCEFKFFSVTAQNYKPRFSKEFLNLEVTENTEPKYLLEDISKHVKDRENDKLRYSLDSKGQKICYIGEYDGELRLRIKPDREVNLSQVFILRKERLT